MSLVGVIQIQTGLIRVYLLRKQASLICPFEAAEFNSDKLFYKLFVRSPEI